MFPILTPPPSSLPIPYLWVVPVQQPQASSIHFHPDFPASSDISASSQPPNIPFCCQDRLLPRAASLPSLCLQANCSLLPLLVPSQTSSTLKCLLFQTFLITLGKDVHPLKQSLPHLPDKNSDLQVSYTVNQCFTLGRLFNLLNLSFLTSPESSCPQST